MVYSDKLKLMLCGHKGVQLKQAYLELRSVIFINMIVEILLFFFLSFQLMSSKSSELQKTVLNSTDPTGLYTLPDCLKHGIPGFVWYLVKTP